MGEDHSHLHEFEDPTGASPKDIASLRWQAVEGITCVPGLSSTARRVCILLITTMDNKTRRSFRGERRIAAELGVHLSAVKKAKAELKDAKLITWFNPGGPRHLSHYNFNWAALRRHALEAKERGDAVVAETISQRRQSTRTGTNQPRSNSTPQGTYKKAEERDVQRAHGTQNEFQGTQISSQGTLQGAAIVPSRVPNLTHDLALKDLAQHITPPQADGGLAKDDDSEKLFVSHPRPQQAEPKGALEGRKKEPPKPLVFFDALVNVLGKDDPKVTVAVTRLGFDQQRRASELLATKGAEAALTYIRENDPKGMAA